MCSEQRDWPEKYVKKEKAQIENCLEQANFAQKMIMIRGKKLIF